MKAITLSIFIGLIVPALLRAQLTDSSNTISRLTLDNTAEVFPGTSIGFQGGTSAFTSNSDVYRYRGIVAISGLVEFDFANTGEIQTMLYSVRPQSSWGVKLKLISAQDQIPGVALLLRSSITWQDDWYQPGEFQNRRPDLYRQGMGIARYQYSFTRAQLVVSENVYSRAVVSLGMGTVDVQVRNVEFWGEAPNASYPMLYSADGVKHTVTAQGFLSVLYPISNELTAIWEIESIPFLNAGSGLTSLTVERAYYGSIGLRYNLNRQFSLDGTYFALTNGSGDPSSELRIGLNMVFTL